MELGARHGRLAFFFAAGLLYTHRSRLIRLPRGPLDCLLRCVNDMSMRIEVDISVREGECSHRKCAGALMRP